MQNKSKTMANIRVKQKVTIREKQASNDRKSLYLDWYDGNGKRTKEYLKLFILENPRNPIERQSNKDVLEKAEFYRVEKEAQAFKGDAEEAKEQKLNKNQHFIEYFEKYVTSYDKKDLRVMRALLGQFKNFAPKNITSKEITESFCNSFKTYLDKTLNGDTPSTYFARFKKMLRQAKRDKLFRDSPAQEIKNTKNDTSLTKAVLTIAEIQLLVNTHCGNPEVKRAFLFCCNTGLRFVDVKALQWKHIKGDVLKLEQAKTKDKASDGGIVEVTLNDTAIKLLGLPADKEALVFKLPSHNSTVDNIKYWAKRAGIDKHLTFHCARHTFGTLLAYYENDIYTISKLLGHTSLKHTTKYVRESNELKLKATNSIPALKL